MWTLRAYISAEQYRTFHEGPRREMSSLFFDREITVTDLHHVPSSMLGALLNDQRCDHSVHVVVGVEVHIIQVLRIVSDDRSNIRPGCACVSGHAP